MIAVTEVLSRAVHTVRDEQSALRDECQRFEEFREAVRLAQPVTTGDVGASQTTETLLDTYRETVMAAPDFDEVYGDPLSEHLEHELSPNISVKFLSKEPFTQRFKRDLLVATSAAIERRTRVIQELDGELERLRSTRDELMAIETELAALPRCSVDDLPFEEFSRLWEVYEELDQRCREVLDERLQEITGTERRGSGVDNEHLFNEYLYRELLTSYPILSAAARIRNRIEDRRGGTPDSTTRLTTK